MYRGRPLPILTAPPFTGRGLTTPRLVLFYNVERASQPKVAGPVQCDHGDITSRLQRRTLPAHSRVPRRLGCAVFREPAIGCAPTSSAPTPGGVRAAACPRAEGHQNAAESRYTSTLGSVDPLGENPTRSYTLTKIWPDSRHSKRSEPSRLESSDPMREAGATSTLRNVIRLSIVQGCCARPTGGSHGRTTDACTQRFKDAERRPRYQGNGDSTRPASV
jgi:hypothetical protein